MLPAHVVDHAKKRIAELEAEIRFLDRPELEMWENTGNGRTDAKPRLLAHLRRALEQYYLLLAKGS